MQVLDANGMLGLKSGTYNTKTTGKKSGELSQLFKKAINGKGIIPYKLERNNNSKAGLFDSYKKSTYDVGDFKKIRGNRAMSAGLMGHILTERTAKPGYDNPVNRDWYDGSHLDGNIAEAKIIGAMLGNSNLSPRPDPDPNPIVNADGSQTLIFDYGATQFQILTGGNGQEGLLLSGFK
jgi:hypothetical protein